MAVHSPYIIIIIINNFIIDVQKRLAIINKHNKRVRFYISLRSYIVFSRSKNAASTLPQMHVLQQCCVRSHNDALYSYIAA